MGKRKTCGCPSSVAEGQDVIGTSSLLVVRDRSCAVNEYHHVDWSPIKGLVIPLFAQLRYRYALPFLVTITSLCLFLANTRLPQHQDWSPIFKTEMVLNLPAVFVATPIGAWPLRGSSDASVIGLTTLLAPFLWFGIGRWVDQQLGTARQKADRPRSRVARTILRVLAYCFLALCLLSVTPLNPTPSPESTFFSAAEGLWLLGYLGCSYWGSRRALPMHSN